MKDYFLGYFISLAKGLVSDHFLTTLGLTGLLAMLSTRSVVKGLLVFFGLYSIARMFMNLADGIHFGLVKVQSALDRFRTNS